MLALEILAGIVGGALGGLLGVGGGIIYVPFLVLVMDQTQKTAQGVSLGLIVITAVVATSTHLRTGNVNVPVAISAAPFAAAAALFGAWIANSIPSDALQRVFAVFILYMGSTMTLRGLPLRSPLRRA